MEEAPVLGDQDEEVLLLVDEVKLPCWGYVSNKSQQGLWTVLPAKAASL